jgi:hypothetical protein
MAAQPGQRQAQDVIGGHPKEGSVFSDCFDATDCHTAARVPHRVLSRTSDENVLIEPLRKMVVKHHASDAKLKRAAAIREILTKRGRHATVKGLRLFPTNANTRKGNFAESLLSEYVGATGKAKTLVYRLRHNPNVDQSMKGDDLLAFHFDKTSTGIVVGEAKFRAHADKTVVVAICEALERSRQGGLPMSLQFVADRLFEAGDATLGKKVLECAVRFVDKKLVVDYAGLLLTDKDGSSYVDKHAPAVSFRCALISMTMPEPEHLVDSCFANLEKEYGFDAR